MRKATVRALVTRVAAGNGLDLVGQFGATAAEAIRSRRDPVAVAQRRRRAARRRVTGWSAGAIVSASFTSYGIVQVAQGSGDPGVIATLVLFLGLLVWCLVGVVRAGLDLRARTATVRSLPAARPGRPAVTAAIRPQISRLDGYSDGLRQLVGMIGVAPGEPSVHSLRDEILAAADEAEVRLRSKAADLTLLARTRGAAPAAARPGLDATGAALRGEIDAGVGEYGRLVTAAGEAVAASRALAGRVPGRAEPLAESTDQLRALAAGMRELSGTDAPEG